MQLRGACAGFPAMEHENVGEHKYHDKVAMEHQNVGEHKYHDKVDGFRWAQYRPMCAGLLRTERKNVDDWVETESDWGNLCVLKTFWQLQVVTNFRKEVGATLQFSLLSFCLQR